MIWASVGVVPASDAPELLSQNSSGAFELDGYRKLIVRGVRGTISMRVGAAGALRYEGRSLDSRRDPRFVALWRVNSTTLLVSSGEADPETPMLIDMAIPPELSVEAELFESKVLAQGMHSDLELTGEGNDVSLRGHRQGASLSLSGGKLLVEGVDGPFRLDTVGTMSQVKWLRSTVDLETEEGRLVLEEVDGDIDFYFEGTEVIAQGIGGRVKIEGLEGSIALAELKNGGEVVLEDSPLTVRLSKNALEIRSNSEIEFARHEGPLTILGFGAAVRGSEPLGPLKLETDSAEVVLQQVQGDTEVIGSGLDLRVAETLAPITVTTSSSRINVSGSTKEVVIRNEYGDIDVSGAKELVQIESTEGNVTMSGLEGPVQLTADGSLVDVSWVKFTNNANSTIRNRSGDVRIGVPARGRCAINAEAPRGRIESDLEGLETPGDSQTLSGEYTGGRGSAPHVKKPLIQASSGGGNLYLTLTAED